MQDKGQLSLVRETVWVTFKFPVYGFTHWGMGYIFMHDTVQQLSFKYVDTVIVTVIWSF